MSDQQADHQEEMLPSNVQACMGLSREEIKRIFYLLMLEEEIEKELEAIKKELAPFRDPNPRPVQI